MPQTTLQDFAVLARRAGLKLTDAQIAVIYDGWAFVEEMIERNRRPPLARDAEPSQIFKPEGF